MNELFHLLMGIRKKSDPKLSIWEQMVPFTDGNLEQTRPKLANMELIFPFAEGKFGTENSPK